MFFFFFLLTLSGLENRDFSGTEPPLDLRPACKFKFVRCGPEEKKPERSICLGSIVAARQSLRAPFLTIFADF